MLKGKENTLQGFTIPRTITCRGCSQKTKKLNKNKLVLKCTFRK